jgi:anti-sigma factor RsiW
MHSDCDQLDDFLTGELPAGEAAQFAEHLTSCDNCRAAMEEQRWIDSLLRSPVAAQINSPSPALVAGVRAAIQTSRQRAGLFVAGLAAAVLLIAAGWVAIGRSHLSEPGPLAAIDGDGQVAEAAVVPARATVVGGPNTLVLPLDSRWPNVTIVRVYAAYQPNVKGGSP